MLAMAADEVTRIKLAGYTLAIRHVGQLGEVDLANLDADAEFPLPMQNTRIPHPTSYKFTGSVTCVFHQPAADGGSCPRQAQMTEGEEAAAPRLRQ